MSTSYSQRRELKTLLVFGILSVLSWLWVPNLVRQGWYSGDPGHVTRAVLSLPNIIGISLASVQAIGIGFFLGLLTLMLFDEKKRVQAALLWLSVFALGAAFVFTDFLPRIFVGSLAPHLPWLVGGFATAVPICLPHSAWEAIFDPNRTMNWEFRRAASILRLLILVAIGTMVLEANLSYPAVQISLGGITVTPEPFVRVAWTNLVIDTTFASAFVVALNKFMAYDRESTVFVVGPSEAGKTYFTVGAYLEESTRTNGRVSNPTQKLLGKVNKINERANRSSINGWSLDSTDTGTAETLSFTLEDGQLFPKNLTIETFDYAGENLAGLAELLERPDLTRDTVEQSHLPDRANLDDVLKMYDRIEASDTLLLLLDATALFPNTSSDDTNRKPSRNLESFAPLISKYADEKRIVFAVTKADVLDKEYEEEVGINIYDRRNLDEFTDQLQYRLTNHPVVGQYLEDTNTEEIYPVYFRTEQTETGARVPDRPEDGRSLAPYGFSRLLEDL